MQYFDKHQRHYNEKDDAVNGGSLHLMINCVNVKEYAVPINKNKQMPIPHLFHQIWLNFNNYSGINSSTGNNFSNLVNTMPPKQYSKMRKSWKQHHPDAQFILWNDTMAHAFIKEYFPDWYQRWLEYKQPICKCDSLRVMLLIVYGGVYVDIDAECYTNMYHLMDKSSVILTQCKSLGYKYLNNFYLAAEATHPFFWFVLKRMESKHRGLMHLSHSVVSPLFVTGPALIASSYRKFARTQPLKSRSIKIINANLVKSDIRDSGKFLFGHFSHAKWVTHSGLIVDVLRGAISLFVVIVVAIFLLKKKKYYVQSTNI